jgi:hypothetical protein
LRFFSPPEKPALTERLSSPRFISTRAIGLLADQFEELDGVDLGLAAVLALALSACFEEVHVVHAGDLDRVLERQEHAASGPLVRFQFEQVFALVGHGRR